MTIAYMCGSCFGSSSIVMVHGCLVLVLIDFVFHEKCDLINLRFNT